MSKFIVKPNQSSIPKAPEPEKDPGIGNISIQRLLDDGLLVLSREIRNLTIASVSGKLDASEARDLRDHIKLLFDMKEKEQESLRDMTDEQLREAAKEAMK